VLHLLHTALVLGELLNLVVVGEFLQHACSKFLLHAVLLLLQQAFALASLMFGLLHFSLVPFLLFLIFSSSPPGLGLRLFQI